LDFLIFFTKALSPAISKICPSHFFESIGLELTTFKFFKEDRGDAGKRPSEDVGAPGKEGPVERPPF
jgi:hypothetical protein